MDRFSLTKGQKKASRELINIALQRECAKFIESLSRTIAKDRKDEKTPHEAYLHIYKRVMTFDKKIQWNYDNVTGSKYFMTVLNLYVRGVLTDEDLELADEEMRTELVNLKETFKSLNH